MIMEFINDTFYESDDERNMDILDLEYILLDLKIYSNNEIVPIHATHFDRFNLNDCFMFSHIFDSQHC